MIFALLWKFTLREGSFPALAASVSAVEETWAWLVCGAKLWLRFNRVWLFPKTNFYSQVQTIFTFCLVAGTMLFIYFQCMDQFSEMQQIRKCWPKSMSDAHSYNDLTHWILPATSGKYVLFYFARTNLHLGHNERGRREAAERNKFSKQKYKS